MTPKERQLQDLMDAVFDALSSMWDGKTTANCDRNFGDRCPSEHRHEPKTVRDLRERYEQIMSFHAKKDDDFFDRLERA